MYLHNSVAYYSKLNIVYFLAMVCVCVCSLDSPHLRFIPVPPLNLLLVWSIIFIQAAFCDRLCWFFYSFKAVKKPSNDPRFCARRGCSIQYTCKYIISARVQC